MLDYIRTPRAAVAAPDAEDRHPPLASRAKPLPAPAVTLWASRALKVACGRVVAVRLRNDGELRVGLAAPEGLRWVAPENVLSTSQAEGWARVARFTSRR